MTRIPPHIPREIAALPVRHHPDYGPLLLNRDVARLFGVGTSTLRRRRANGRFPATAVQEPTASWYRLDDIVRVYHESFSNFFSTHSATLSAETGAEKPGRRRDGAEACRDHQCSSVTAELIREAVRETLLDCLEYEDESPATIDRLSKTVAEQQQVISSLGAEIKRLSAMLEEPLRFAQRRHKPRRPAATRRD